MATPSLERLQGLDRETLLEIYRTMYLSRRIDDMRRNLIKTQKALKAMREFVLESPSTELSEPIHDMLEYLIAQNRRANYVVAPPSALPVHVRLPDGTVQPVLQMSRQFLELPVVAAPAEGDWRGVLVLPSLGADGPGTLQERQARSQASFRR